MNGLVLFAYLVAVILFAFGIRMLRSPSTAKKGNLLSAVGMAIALITALIQPMDGSAGNYIWIAGAMLAGAAIGWPIAQRVQMTAMPQLVAMFNGLGGASAMVLAIVEYMKKGGSNMATGELLILFAALAIGAISFTGSIIAWAKLQGVMWKNFSFRGHDVVNFLMLGALIVLGVLCFVMPDNRNIFFAIMAGLAMLYGLSFVVPIGGADMPVVISLLNSLTGLSAAAAGLVYQNKAMIIGGLLVGASGTILTILMCKAMNRSLWNVVGAGANFGAKAIEAGEAGTFKEVTSDDLAVMLQYSENVMVIPGYGMAVAQAQKVAKELDDVLSKEGVNFKYGIHPVAGRMPGHMNVLLAEADVPYDKLLDLDDANDALNDTDVVMVIGANDVVNPAADDDPNSPIYGMPILDTLKAKSVIVLKRGRGTGYSGIQNQLFFHDKTRMYFGDAKESLGKLVAAVKENL